jgi:hypothetical protein
MRAPGDGAMEGTTFKDASEVGLGGGLFVWMDKGEKRLSGEEGRLRFEMVGKNGVEIDELKVGGEEGPVWKR